VKLQKHDSPPLMKLLIKLFSKKQLYWWSWAVPNRAIILSSEYVLYSPSSCVGWQENSLRCFRLMPPLWIFFSF
jgi:hypothetical protein